MTKEFFEQMRLQYGKEATSLTRDVLSVVSAKIRAKNLFAWHHYIDEVLEDLVCWMIKTEFKYSGGAYVACGMQSAIDHCRYCNAAKRKPYFDTLSLDDDEVVIQVPDRTVEDDSQAWMLYVDIKMQFGPELADAVKPFLEGTEKALSKEVLVKLKTPEFMDWLKQRSEI